VSVVGDVTQFLEVNKFSHEILLAALSLAWDRVLLAQDQVVKDFAGCYELRSRDRSMFLKIRPSFLPKGLELTDHCRKEFDSKVRSDMPLSSWRVKGDDTVSLK